MRRGVPGDMTVGPIFHPPSGNIHQGKRWLKLGFQF